MASATRALSLLSSLSSPLSWTSVSRISRNQAHTTVEEVMRAVFEEISLRKFFTQDNKYVPLSFGLQW